MGALQNIRVRSSVSGGQFALWGLLFSTFDCTYAELRHKEDPWNAIMSGGTTGAILAARQGAARCAVSAVTGAIILACIEGASIMIQRFTAQQGRMQAAPIS